MKCPVAKWIGSVLHLCVVLLLMTACTVFQSAIAPSNTKPNLEMPSPTYRLGGNDFIRIEVFGEPDLTTETVVNGQGFVKFPLLGEQKIGGKTVKETEQHLTQLLKAGYLKDPKVSVYIVQHRNVYLSGEVKSPGAYPYKEGLTVLKAITLAGGFTEKASEGSVQVLRTDSGKEVMLSLDVDDPVKPDDLIIISESFF